MVSVEGIISSSTENNNGIDVDDADQISIFDAEKYFSEECNNNGGSNSKPPQLSHDLPSPAGHGRSSMAESLRATPSAPSVASSNDSQSSLLTKTFASYRTRKKWSAAKKWFFTRNCCCSNAKSVRVKELIISDSDRRGPIVMMDSKKSNILHAESDRDHSIDDDQMQKQIITSQILSLSRFSIKDNVVEIHRNIISGTDAPRQQRISATGRPFINGGTVGFTFPISDVARDDDAGSDASSDLFEIESFSTQAVVDDDSKGERKFAAATLRGAAADASSEAGGGEGKRKSDGMRVMGCRPGNVAAEGPPAISLHVGGRPLPARRGGSQSSPLAVAG